MKLHIVLVRSEHSANIGSVARAMANMGADRLILIDPRCRIDSAARANAAGAQDWLSGVRTYNSWSEFYENEGDGLRIALSRRAGRNRRVTALRAQLDELGDLREQDLYLIFGPESDGLDADDLAFVNYTCHLPVYGEFASLNLAQAVLLALFIAREKFPPGQLPKQMTGEVAKTAKPFYFPDQQIKDWLEAMGFDVEARKSSAYLTLRRLFLQNRPTRHELQVLEAVLRQNIRKLRERGDSPENGSLRLALKKLTDDLGDIAGQ